MREFGSVRRYTIITDAAVGKEFLKLSLEDTCQGKSKGLTGSQSLEAGTSEACSWAQRIGQEAFCWIHHFSVARIRIVENVFSRSLTFDVRVHSARVDLSRDKDGKGKGEERGDLDRMHLEDLNRRKILKGEYVS